MASYLSHYCVVLFILNCYILDFIYSDFIIIIWAIFVNRFGTLIMSHYIIAPPPKTWLFFRNWGLGKNKLLLLFMEFFRWFQGLGCDEFF